ncbi:MAG: leucine-rich repeat domain-containing protein, partial [Treponema sp.]|nr:leucine-rich repeat domain-containing protein [Treponema sp.]
MTKKTVCGLTIGVMVILVGTALFGQNTADFNYEANNGAVTITGYTGSAKNVTIPNQIDNLPVTAIGELAFRGNQLTGVSIPNSVTAIGNLAFSGNDLTGVTIPNLVTAIGDRAFEGNDLTSVSIPNSVTAIGNSAFGYNQLTSVTIPANVDVSVSSFNSLLYALYTTNGRKAAVYAFSRSKDGDFDSMVCNHTVEITAYRGKAAELAIPEKINGLPVVAIGRLAFARKQLTHLTIPNGVTAIGDWAFTGNNLTSVTIPDSVTAIGYLAFARNKLTHLTIPN